jgi:hypothetical protein
MNLIEKALALAVITTSAACAPHAKEIRETQEEVFAKAAQAAQSHPSCFVRVNAVGYQTRCYYQGDLNNKDGRQSVSISLTCPEGRVVASDQKGTFACLPSGYKNFIEFKRDCLHILAEIGPTPWYKTVWPIIKLTNAGNGFYPEWVCDEEPVSN